jgi:hypothetical protein
VSGWALLGIGAALVAAVLIGGFVAFVRFLDDPDSYQ